MSPQEVQTLVREIVSDALQLHKAHCPETKAVVNYVCIFSHTDEELHNLRMATAKLGSIVEDTPTGFVYYISPISTVAGDATLLKIRNPDPTRFQLGDADFTVLDYLEFKNAHVSKPGFKLIQRSDFEMLELADDAFSVLAYYSQPTLLEILEKQGKISPS